MWDLFQRGGILMYFIAGCSVIALAVLLERLWSLRRRRVIPASFIGKVRELVAGDHTSEAQVLCQNDPSSIAAVFAGGLRHLGAPRNQIKEALEEAGRHEAASLERYVGVIGTVAAISPLLGLLGTVTGMIRVFQDITVQGVGNPADLASGIWEALITTAYGLVVAIPALVAYRYLGSRVDQLTLEMEEEALELVELMRQRTEAVTTDSASS